MTLLQLSKYCYHLPLAEHLENPFQGTTTLSIMIRDTVTPRGYSKGRWRYPLLSHQNHKLTDAEVELLPYCKALLENIQKLALGIRAYYRGLIWVSRL